MAAVTAYYECEKPIAFRIPDDEFNVSSEVAEALAGFLEPSDCPLFAIDDIFNTDVPDSVFAAIPDNLVSSRSHNTDCCSLHCCAKRQRCCYSGELQQPLCFEAEFDELQQLLCFEAEFMPADPQELHYFQPSPLAERSEPPPQPPQHSDQTPFSAKFAEPQQSLCFEPEQSICFETEFTPAEPTELHYFQPTPLAEHPEQPPPPPPQHFDQTQFPREFTFNPPRKTAAGNGLSAQSTAARERRKRISDKTQELSRLIPGGRRMNTAEMLQAAHNYVRFLQAQTGILELNKEKSGGEEQEEELFQVLITSTAIQEKLSKQGMCLVPAVIAEEFMEREINKFSELIGEKA